MAAWAVSGGTSWRTRRSISGKAFAMSSTVTSAGVEPTAMRTLERMTAKAATSRPRTEMTLLKTSFETIVNAGSKTEPGHGRPTDARLEPGDLLHIDFGVRSDGYCSDLQRLLYFRRRGETDVQNELQDAFATVKGIISETAKRCRPGVRGWEIDAAARKMLTDHGYPEYQHGLGHQLGRSVHDGGALLGPKWERYGKTPTLEVEANYVFTLELEIMLAGIGCVGLEEDIVVTEHGGRFLCPRQLELVVK